jgi:hypothetical protein
MQYLHYECVVSNNSNVIHGGHIPSWDSNPRSSNAVAVELTTQPQDIVLPLKSKKNNL